jgi:hypothetical protein
VEEPDPTSTQFGRESRVLGAVVSMDGDDWARQFLAVEVKEHVPDEVRELFAVARGAALYGWFYYPMFYLGEEQLHRVMETAAKAAYRQLGGTIAKPRFAEVIDWLVRRRAIHPEDAERWHGVRWLRNAASHPERQSVVGPPAVLAMFKAGAHDMNRLFMRVGAQQT